MPSMLAADDRQRPRWCGRPQSLIAPPLPSGAVFCRKLLSATVTAPLQ